jgi:hypothetical protein
VSWYLSLFVALMSSLTLSEAHAYSRLCNYGNAGAYGWSSNLNPTFLHQVVLSAYEASIAYEYGGILNLKAPTPFSSCNVGSVRSGQATGGNTGFANVIEHAYATSSICRGLTYRYEFRRFFTVTFTYVDPNDPFGYEFIYDGPWPNEGIPCPTAYIYGVLN